MTSCSAQRTRAGWDAPGPVVGDGRRVLVALHEGGIHIERGPRLPGPPLQGRHQRAVRHAQPCERGGLLRDRRGGPRGPQGPVLDMEGLKEISDRGRGGQRVSQQRGQGLILAERREVLTAIPAARPERDEALDELRGGQAPLPLFDRDVRIDRLGRAELPEQFNQQRDPGPTRDERRIDRVVNLERQPWRRVRHRSPPWCGCTQRVKPSKPDAIGAPRLHRGPLRNPFGCSTV